MTSGCRVAIEAAAVPVVIETDAEYAVTHDMAPEVRLISSGDQGPPGPPGGVVIQRSAGHLISALRVVYEASGLVYVLDYRDAAHIDLLVGITMTAADGGAPIAIQRAGEISDSGWAWTPGRVYLGVAGQLTQTPPETGYSVLIGSAVSATRILLNLQDPIELE